MEQDNGLIWVKEEGRTGFSEGWQGCSEGFPKGEAQGKSSDLNSFSNTVFQSTEVSRRVNFLWTFFQLTYDNKLQILTQLSFHKFVLQNIFVINYFLVGPL